MEIIRRRRNMRVAGLVAAAILVQSDGFAPPHSLRRTISSLAVSKRTRNEPSVDSPKPSGDKFPIWGLLDRPTQEDALSRVEATFSGNHYVSGESPLDDDTTTNNQPLILGALAALSTVAAVGVHYSSISFSDITTWAHQLQAHPQDTLQAGVDAVQAMGPSGVLVFGLIYLVAEILAVPATPLTLSAGYLFGVVQGTAIVLLAATAAACVAFFIGKTFLRSWVEKTLQENPKFAKLDKAIGKEGFKLLLLVRLSPIFPFALSNYVYGASSIDFASYFWGTLLGFAPGTVAYVYTGMVGKALTLGGGGSEPWYVYAGGFTLLAVFLKLATDVASEIVEAIDNE
jgi:uncharacterized membrane protein YdjX (TVP38/TMEM64 family)